MFLFLQVGDVVQIKRGMRIYTGLMEKFVFSNLPYSTNIYAGEVEVGEIRTTSATTEVFSTDFLVGDYVVVSAQKNTLVTTPFQGGHVRGRFVVCKKLHPDGTFDRDGVEVGFYQESGYLGSLSPEDIQPVRRMDNLFV